VGVFSDITRRRQWGAEFQQLSFHDGLTGLPKNRTWARLIQKIYEVDPLTCPKCQGQMRILALIEDEEVIEKNLRESESSTEIVTEGAFTLGGV